LYWCGTWRRGSARQAISMVQRATFAHSAWRQRASRQAIATVSVGSWSACIWRCVPFRQAVFEVIEDFVALRSWRYVSLARQFRSWQCLAVCVPCQANLRLQPWVAESTCVIYKAFGDASKVGLQVFLELSSKRIPWVKLGIGVKHVAFIELSSEWHPSSWARDGRWTRGTLKLSSGWRVLSVWVCWLWPVQMDLERLPSLVVNWRVW